VCRHLVTFESTECLHCATALVFDWDARELAELRAPCANREPIACNGAGEGLCAACRLTRTRPPDDVLAEWAAAEAAKRRLVFELLELGLPIGGGLAFDLLSSDVEPVTTGHADGVITLDLAEADPVAREQRRTQLSASPSPARRWARPTRRRCTPIPAPRAATCARCSTPGSRSPTRSTRSAAASATTMSTRSCSRPWQSRSWRSSMSSSG
jgi:hypothetical protein